MQALTRGVYSKRKVALISALTFVSIILLVASLGYARTDIPSMASKYEENLARAKNVGLPTNLEEAEKYFGGPNDLSIDKEIEDPCQHMIEFMPKLDNPKLSDEDFASIWSKLGSDAKVIEQVLSKPNPRLSIDLRSEEVHSLELLRPLSSWSKAFTRQATVLQAAGKDDEAFRCLILSSKIAHVTSSNATIMGLMIRILCAAFIEECLATFVIDKPDIWKSRAREILTRLDEPMPLQKAITLQYCTGLRFAKNMVKQDQQWFIDTFEKNPGQAFWISRLPRYGIAAESTLHMRFADLIEQVKRHPSDLGLVENDVIRFSTENRRGGASYLPLENIIQPSIFHELRAEELKRKNLLKMVQ